MPFLLIIVGAIMVVTAWHNTHVQFAQQLRRDGTDFIKYGVAIGGIGAAGYIPDLEPISRLFLALIIVSLVLSNSKTGRGIIGNFEDAINAGPK